MRDSTKAVLFLGAANFAVFAVDAVGIWLVYLLAFGLTPVNWWWLIGLGLFGRWIIYLLSRGYWWRQERERRRTTLAELGKDAVATFSMREAALLVKMFGGEEASISVAHSNGHSGPGLYAWFTEYPEEGAVFLTNPTAKARDVDG